MSFFLLWLIVSFLSGTSHVFGLQVDKLTERPSSELTLIHVQLLLKQWTSVLSVLPNRGCSESSSQGCRYCTARGSALINASNLATFICFESHLINVCIHFTPCVKIGFVSAWEQICASSSLCFRYVLGKISS